MSEALFYNTHRVTPQRVSQVEEAIGQLVSDPGGTQVRFELGDRTAFVVPYERIIVIHYEKVVGPSKWGWPVKDTKYYVTIHYADSAGQPTFETVRLSARDVPLALDALEADTALTIDRTLARRSFLGI